MSNNNDGDYIEGYALTSTHKPFIRPKPIAQLHEFYLSGVILEPENYIYWFDTIRHAGVEDTVKIFINSGGGDLFTGIQFMRVLAETEATVVVSIEGLCASAATLVLLSADVFEITPHSMFLFHTYSGGTYGKGSEMYSQISHERKWSEKLFTEVYEGFLTPEEIESMIANRDIWMDSEEVAERMRKRIEQAETTE